jgi:nucleoside-diphosphate-sugar epimerase
MKILITGARGNFPTALIPRLAAQGHNMVLFDLEPMSAPEHSISAQGDIRDAGLLTHVMQGCDAVIHAVAYHGNASGSRNYEDYFSVNVTGTQNVLRAMLLNGVKSLVFSSSEVVYGDGMRGVRVMDEEVPCIPTHIYPLTKVLSEEMCRFYARKHGLHIAILRYGCFVPADWKTAGMGRLNNWLDREDVASANELALGAVVAEAFSCEAFLIHCAKPFVDSDWPALETEPEKVIEYYFPGANALLAEHDLRIPHVHTRFDISKAVTTLGYDPQHNFEQFLDRLRKTGRNLF